MFDGFFKNRVFDKTIEASLNTNLIAPLPTPTVDGYSHIYAAVLDKDPRNFILNNMFKAAMMIFDLWQYEEGTWPGLVITVNMKHCALAHITKLDVMTVKRVLYFLQSCVLSKIKAIHFINAPTFVDKLMMIMKPFLNNSLLDIMHIHPVGTDSVYHQYISKESLPKDDGGSYLSYEEIKESTIKRLQSNPEFFRNENLKRVDESLRPGGAAAVHDEFGVQGSFKQLDLD